MKITYSKIEAENILSRQFAINNPKMSDVAAIEVEIDVSADIIANRSQLEIYCEVFAKYTNGDYKEPGCYDKLTAIKTLRDAIGYENLGLAAAKRLIESYPSQVLIHYNTHHKLTNF